MISSQTFVWSYSRVPPSLHGGLQHSAQHFFHYLHFIFPLPCLPQPPIHCVSGWNARCQGLHRLLMVSWWRSGQNTAAYFYIHLSHQLRSPSRLFPRNFYVKCLILNLACFWYDHFKCQYGPRLCMRPSSSGVWPWRCLHHLRHSVTASPCCDVMWWARETVTTFSASCKLLQPFMLQPACDCTASGGGIKTLKFP